MIKFLHRFIPKSILDYRRQIRIKKIYSSEYLLDHYHTDLTESERWTILSIVLSLERKLKVVHYLEIGVFAGGTIRFLKDNSNTTIFTGIDLFEDFKPSQDNTHGRMNFKQEIVQEALGTDRTILHKGFSKDVLLNLNPTKKFDIIFIDGNHTYEATKEDLLTSLPTAKNGSFYIFHNASPGLSVNSGRSNEDREYLKRDGGPFLLCLELRDDPHFKFILASDRIQVFKYKPKS